MLWLVGFFLLGIVGLAGVAIFSMTQAQDRIIGIIVIAAALLLNIAWTGIHMTHIIDAREVGVVRTFGSITGQIGEGFQLTWPWQSVEKWNIRTQVIVPDTACVNGVQECMDAGSIDVQDVYINGALNMSVNPEDVQDLARTVGPSYRDTIVLNRLYQVVKETTAKYKAEDILASREEIRNIVRDRMVNEMSQYSINVHDFLITNIAFTEQFKQAIEAKVVTEQQAEQERNRVAISEAQAQQAAAQAQGEADRLRITAEGQAEANRLIAESLTPELIQFQAIQKFADNVSIALLPSGTGNFLDLSQFGLPLPQQP